MVTDTDSSSRDELLARAKERALAYVTAGNLAQALASMLSDMDNLPGNTREGNDAQGMSGMSFAMVRDADGLRRWIEAVP